VYISEIYSENGGRLFISGAPSSEQELLGWIKTYKLTCFINLMREQQYSHVLEAFNFYNLPECAYIQFPITDGEAPTLAQARTLCLFVDALLLHQHRILLHCKVGCGRAPTIAAAYLIRKNHWTLNQAIAHLKEKKVCFPDFSGFIPSQMKFLEIWQALFHPSAKY